MDQIRKIIKIGLAEIPLMLLLVSKSRAGMVAAAAALLALMIFFAKREPGERQAVTFDWSVVVLFLCICAGLRFYLRWQNTGRIRDLALSLGFTGKQFCALLAAVLSLGAWFSLAYLLTFFRLPAVPSRLRKPLDMLYVLLLAAGIITIASKSSPFYPFNDWVDPQTMFTLGKGMLRGRVPYRDLYEQKGPLLLALHALAAFISFDSLLGVWLIEIAACFCTLWFLYQILSDHFGRKALALLPLLGLLICLPRAFVAGDSAEEMSLPLLTWGLITGIKAVRQNRLPDRKESFLIGITSGCILWIKFSHLGFYAGWFLFFAVKAFRSKRSGELPGIIGRIAAGAALTCIPVFLYFAINRAVGIFLECYFLNNVRYYPAFGTARGPFRHIINLFRGAIQFASSNGFVLASFVTGMICCFLPSGKKDRFCDKDTGRFMLLTFLSGYILIFFSGTSFPYYVMIFGSFGILGVAGLADFLRPQEKHTPAAAAAAWFLSVMAVLLFSPNIYVTRYELSDFPQYKAMKLIEASGIEHPSLLHYGFLDAGYNLMTGIVPEQRFFSFFNLKLPGMAEEQKRYVEEGQTDFVVTCHVPLYETDKYELIDTSPGDFTAHGDASAFFLYQRTADAP